MTPLSIEIVREEAANDSATCDAHQTAGRDSIIQKLNRVSWDNWLLFSLNALTALLITFSLIGNTMVAADDFEACRRRNELEEVLRERRRYREDIRDTERIPVMKLDGKPEHDEMSSAPKAPKRYRFRSPGFRSQLKPAY